MVRVAPRKSYGASTGQPPIHVKRSKVEIKDQNSGWQRG